MRTEYGEPGFAGLEFGKPVRLPQLRREPEQTSRQTTVSLEKENLKNRTNAFEVVGEKVGKYKLGTVIGRGSNSVVRVVRDGRGEAFAMKSYVGLSEGEMHKRRNIMREIGILASLDHPHILRYVDAIHSPDSVHIVLELLESRSLHTLFRKPLDLFELKLVAKDLLSALAYLHTKGIAHRDVKAQNVLLQPDGIRLIDFGYSVHDSHPHHDFCGTPHYIAPQVIAKAGYKGDKADVWAAGVLFFRLATGRFPFKGVTHSLLYKAITRAQFSPPSHLDPLLLSFLTDILVFDPSARPSAHSLLTHSFFQL